jgi:hypothetical protein
MTRGHRGPLLLRCRALSSPSPCRFIPAHPQFPSSLSERSAPHTPGSSSRLQLQGLHRFRGLRRDFGGSALPVPCLATGPLTTPQASLYATDRSVAPPEGLLKLGFDARRFPLTPPACYRASWQLPGPDLRRQATTSLSLSGHPVGITSNWLGARIAEAKGGAGSASWCDGRPT